jgi:hypothetical protein
MRHAPQPKGFVLLLVIGVLTVLFIYFWAAQSDVQYTFLQSHRIIVRTSRAEATASILALVQVHGKEWIGRPQRLDWDEMVSANYQIQAMPANDALWPTLPGLVAQSGDALLTIRWENSSVIPARNRYLINLEGLRPGAIAIMDPPAAPAEPSPISTGERPS